MLFWIVLVTDCEQDPVMKDMDLKIILFKKKSKRQRRY